VLIALACSWLPLFETPWVPEKTPSSFRFHSDKAPDSLRFHKEKKPHLLDFHTVDWGRGLSQAGLTVVNDQSQWSNLWTRLCTSGTYAIDIVTGRPACPPLPVIDFATRTVLAVSSGLEGNTGFAINITRVIEYKDHVEVQATLETDGLNCVYAAIIINPGHVIEIPKTQLPTILKTISIAAPSCPLPSASAS
jgi:hypothetical protein